MFHYVYRITNIKLNRHYYGTRSSKINPIIDLGTKYFSSSSNKDFIKDQKLNSSNYKYKVINVFGTRLDAMELEIKLHNKFDVGINESFYNKVKQTSTGFDRSGITHTVSSDTKRKMSDSHKGKKFSQQHKDKIALASSKRKQKESSKIKIGKSSSQRTKGSLNPSARQINIYNKDGIVMFKCNGDFKRVCESNNLPHQALYDSHHNNGKQIYNTNSTKSRAINNGLEMYIGWYATKEIY